jgi:hypothetical protein
MIGLLIFLLRLLLLPFKPKLRLEAENAALRQQVSILQRKLRGRVQLTNGNRLFFLQLYDGSRRSSRHDNRPAGHAAALASRGCPSLLALEIQEFGRTASYIRRIAGIDPAHEPREPALGGAAHSWRVLKLGFVMAQSTVAKYMAQRGGMLPK